MSYDKSDGERDDFWDISKLVPKKRGSLSPFSSSDPTRDYTASSGVEPDNDSVRNAEERKLDFSGYVGTRSAEEITYTPDGDSLIKSVKICHYIDRYDFYDNFRKSALIYFDYHPTARAEFVQFYSYMPQYSQLTPQQRAYYFYWRGEMQRGKYLKTDYSYIYLYVYEILNLPDKIPPKEGVRMLCRLWAEYRHSLPRLDGYFSIWVQDYCLVHRLPCPTEEISDFIFDVITAASFKEFYLSDINHAGSRGTAAMLAYLSDYDWRRGKYAAGNPEGTDEQKREQAVLYRTYMEGATSLLLRQLWSECISKGKTGRTEIIRRDAFPNSLCTHMVKRKLEIEYYPIAAAGGIRVGVTAAVRYTENKIRAILGVKSRLAVKDLPNEYRRIIDYYFDVIFERESKRRARENEPAYLRLYDKPDEKMSSTGADEIERASWDTTARLVYVSEYYEFPDDTSRVCTGACKSSSCEGIIDQTAPASTPYARATDESGSCDADCAIAENSRSADGDQAANTYGLSRNEIAYIATFFGDEFDETYIPDRSITVDTLVERINEAFTDGFGDVIIEPSEDGYALIEDYKEEVHDWLTKILK